MLEKVDLDKKLSKDAYQHRFPRLRRRLLQLQKACWDAKIPSIVLFEGWDAAGKGSTIRKLTERLEPRGFQLHLIRAARTSELQMPWMWRFWLKIPNYGEMAIFDRSWYGRVRLERLEGIAAEHEWRQAYRDIYELERMLSDDGYVIVKLFLHVSRKEQRKRFRKLGKDPSTAWQVEKEDWRRHGRYDEYLVAAEEMLVETDTEWGPWVIVEATDRRWTQVKVLTTLVDRLEAALEAKGQPLPPVFESARDAEFVEQVDEER